HSRNQLTQSKGLGEIVVRAEVKAEDDTGLFIAYREDDDRCVPGSTDFFAQLVTAAIWKTEIQQYQIERAKLEQVTSFFQLVSQADLETFLFERVFYPHGNRGIIFDEKDGRHEKIPKI